VVDQQPSLFSWGEGRCAVPSYPPSPSSKNTQKNKMQKSVKATVRIAQTRVFAYFVVVWASSGTAVYPLLSEIPFSIHTFFPRF
jgi:S-adenosylmethionine/arginine decarboxylase-like enzyme